MIPDEAVEAAAQALRDAFDWDVGGFEEQAKRALEAAAPHLIAPILALAYEWSRDAERAEHYADHGFSEAEGVREAAAMGEAAAELRALLSGGHNQSAPIRGELANEVEPTK